MKYTHLSSVSQRSVHNSRLSKKIADIQQSQKPFEDQPDVAVNCKPFKVTNKSLSSILKVGNDIAELILPDADFAYKTVQTKHSSMKLQLPTYFKLDDEAYFITKREIASGSTSTAAFYSALGGNNKLVLKTSYVSSSALKRAAKSTTSRRLSQGWIADYLNHAALAETLGDELDKHVNGIMAGAMCHFKRTGTHQQFVVVKEIDHDLFDLLDAGLLKSEIDMLKLCSNLAESVMIMQQNSFIIGDLSENNVLVNNNLECLLFDFDGSRFSWQSIDRHVSTSHVISYERAREECEETLADDKFALGALLMLITTGETESAYEMKKFFNSRRARSGIEHILDNNMSPLLSSASRIILRKLILDLMNFHGERRPAIASVHKTLKGHLESIETTRAPKKRKRGSCEVAVAACVKHHKAA